MSSGLSQRLERVARDHVPIAATIIFAVLSAAPFYVPGYGMVAANLTLMSVFYWSVHRADLLSPIAVFVIGLLHDVLTGVPIGLSAVIFVLLRAVVSAQSVSMAGKPFVILWAGFWVAGIATGFTIWVVNSLLHLTLLDPTPALFHALLTIALFPFVAWVLAWIQQRLLRAD